MFGCCIKIVIVHVNDIANVNSNLKKLLNLRQDVNIIVNPFHIIAFLHTINTEKFCQ